MYRIDVWSHEVFVQSQAASIFNWSNDYTMVAWHVQILFFDVARSTLWTMSKESLREMDWILSKHRQILDLRWLCGENLLRHRPAKNECETVGNAEPSLSALFGCTSPKVAWQVHGNAEQLNTFLMTNGIICLVTYPGSMVASHICTCLQGQALWRPQKWFFSVVASCCIIALSCDDLKSQLTEEQLNTTLLSRTRFILEKQLQDEKLQEEREKKIEQDTKENNAKIWIE